MREMMQVWLLTLLLTFGLAFANEHQGGDAAAGQTQEQATEPEQTGEDDEGGTQLESTQSVHALVPALQADPKFSIFTEALLRSKVLDRLRAEGEEGPFTILAPTNEAFYAAGLQAGEVEQGGFAFGVVDPGELYELVRNHIIPGAVTAEDLERGGELTAVSGNQFVVTGTGTGDITAETENDGEGEVAGGGKAGEAEADSPFSIEGARVVHLAPETSGGIIYGIDEVLLPHGIDTNQGEENGGQN